MHIIGIRKALLLEYPWLAVSVYKAFAEARELARERFADTTAPVVMLPWYGYELDRTIALMGSDFWPYGVEANRNDLSTLCRYVYEQGITDSHVSIGELFASSTISQTKV